MELRALSDILIANLFIDVVSFVHNIFQFIRN